MHAANVYLLICAVTSLLFQTAFVYGAVYRLQAAGLDPLELVLVGTVLELSVFLFEIPTGVVADLKSRRLSVILGYFLIGAGFILEGSLPVFVAILLGQVLWGVGFTFTSGALDAWLADEVGEDRLTDLLLRGAQASQVAAFGGILLSAYLVRFHLGLPLVVAGIGFVALSLLLVVILQERGFRPTPREERQTWRGMAKILRDALEATRRRPALRNLFGAALFTGLASEAIDRLWEAHLLTSFPLLNWTLPGLGRLDPVLMIAVINAAAMAATLMSTEVMRRRSSTLEPRSLARFFLLQQILVIFALLTFALSRQVVLAALAYIAIHVLRQTAQPLLTAWVNRGLRSSVRATVLSTLGQCDALGQVVGGPLLGGVARSHGLRAALLAAAGMLLPALAFYKKAADPSSE